jgi:CheY-like chemotaxis protein
VQTVIARSPRKPRATSPTTPLVPPRALRLLVADDNRANLAIMTHALEKQGCEVVAVEDGRQAVDAVARERFDAVLLDIEMPTMNGFEATAAIRARERDCGGRVPVIALTAHSVDGDRARYREAGMDDCATKPLRAAAILATLRPLLATNGRSHDTHRDDSRCS